MLASARRAISYPNPDRSDRPDIPAHFLNLVNKMDVDLPITFGTFAARPANPGHAMQGYWATDTSLMYLWDGAAWFTISASALSYVGSYLTSNVAIDTVNVFGDGPSVSLVQGTWILWGSVLLTQVGSSPKFTAKIWDGTTAFTGNEIIAQNDGFISLDAKVAPTTTTTYKISVARTSGGASGSILATPGSNNSGLTNKASYLHAVKIG